MIQSIVMINSSKITLDKIEVARRQLGSAIDLWFADGDPVAIHTLACAAHEVLAALLKRQGKSTLMFDPIWYQPGYAGEVKKALHKHYNFFKHADQDADASIEFPVGITEVFLLMAADGWRDLVGVREPSHFAYWSWCYIHHPDVVKLNDRQNGTPMERLPDEIVNNFITLPKKQFRILTMEAFRLNALNAVV